MCARNFVWCVYACVCNLFRVCACVCNLLGVRAIWFCLFFACVCAQKFCRLTTRPCVCRWQCSFEVRFVLFFTHKFAFCLSSFVRACVSHSCFVLRVCLFFACVCAQKFCRLTTHPCGCVVDSVLLRCASFCFSHVCVCLLFV